MKEKRKIDVVRNSTYLKVDVLVIANAFITLNNKVWIF